MEIENQELPASAPSSLAQISYGTKALGLFLTALALQNFPITNQKLLRFALVTGSLGGAVWMSAKWLIETLNEEGINRTKVATGLKKGDLATLNQLIERSPIPGERPLFAQTLSQRAINFLHDELLDLDDTMKRVLEAKSDQSQYSRGRFSVRKSSCASYMTLEIEQWGFHDLSFQPEVTPEQCTHLLFGYCQMRSDLFKGVAHRTKAGEYPWLPTRDKLHLYPIEQPLPEGAIATCPLFRDPLPLEEPDLLLFNHYLEAGGGSKIEAFPEGKEEEIEKIYKAMREVLRYLDHPSPLQEIRIDDKLWVKLLKPQPGEPQGRKRITFPDLPEDLFLPKEQLKALFLGEMAEHQDHLGAQLRPPSQKLLQGGYLLWEKKGIIEVTTRKQFLEVKETKAVWEQIKEGLKVTKKEWNHFLEELTTGKLQPNPWFTPCENGDIEITFKTVTIKGEDYLILDKQRIHCSKENVYQILVGCVASKDFPGIEKVVEIEKGVKYRLVRK